MKINLLSTIRSRIVSGFFLLLVIIILSELVAYYRIRSLPNIIAINVITQGFTKLKKEETLLKATAAEFILREKNSLSFFKTGQIEFLNLYQKSFKALHQNLETVQKQTLELGLNKAEEVSVLKQAL